ncbi:MAG TPA: TolC family protein [Gemmatimonadaceae bacterium]|nr:TolC family protein [Gemmatimonadaceae bacterium]
MMSRSIILLGGAIQLAVALPALAQRPAASMDTIRLSLEEAVTNGLRISDEVLLSAAQADIADAQVGNARAALLPQLRLSAAYTRTYESARSSAVSNVFNQPNTYTTNANVSQTLFQGGRIVATARSASSLAAAAHLDAQEQQALFTVTVQRAYLGALLAERLVELQETNLQLASARLTQVQQFQTAGRAAQYDVLRAKVERANIEPVAIQARNDRDLAHLELKRLLNLSLDRPLVLTSTVDPSAAQALVIAYLDSTALPNRPALRSAELVSRSRHFAVTAARADLFPTITWFFQTGYGAFPPFGFGFPSERGSLNVQCGTASQPRLCQNGGWFEDRNMGVQFSWPLFDGLRAKSALQLAKAATRVADLQLQQEREQVAVEVARARAELQRAKSVFDGRRETSSEAQEAFRLASLRFTRGLSTQLEVSDAQLALLTAESGEARATFDLYLATAELARALGRPIPMPATMRAPARRTDN